MKCSNILYDILAVLGCYAAQVGIARAEPDGTRAETRFRLSPKRTSPLKSVGASVQSTAGSRGVRISFSNAGCTTFGGGVRVLATHSIRQFPLHFPSRASPCATRFRTSSSYRLFGKLCPSHLQLSSCATHCISVMETNQYVLCKVSCRLCCSSYESVTYRICSRNFRPRVFCAP